MNKAPTSLPSSEIVLEITGLTKSFENNFVLRGVDFKLMRGENIVVLGKSGCGKSVFIKCISGLLPYDSGTIKVFNQNISGMSNRQMDKMREKIGFLFQSNALYDSMTIRENLEFPLIRHFRLKSQAEINNKVKEVLKNVGLLNTIDMMPSELSGGMRKRIGLARALIMKPEIMLYDEPTTGLDPITAKEISNLMLDMQKKYNTSSIIISHDMNCAKITANRLLVLINGIFYAEGTFGELKQSKDEKIKAFFE